MRYRKKKGKLGVWEGILEGKNQKSGEKLRK